MKTINEIFAEISDVKHSYVHTVNILEKIEPVLKSFHGKKITKRIETAVQKVLPEYSVFYKIVGSMYYLLVWGNGISYNDRIQFLLGYTSYSKATEDIFHFDEGENNFVYHNKGYYMNKERAEELDKVSLSYLKELQDEYKEIQERIKEFKKKINPEYPVYKYFEFKE